MGREGGGGVSGGRGEGGGSGFGSLAKVGRIVLLATGGARCDPIDQSLAARMPHSFILLRSVL
jgi:hypothetical protein